MIENISNLSHSKGDALVPHNLLLIDDEIDIVKSLYRQFRNSYAVYRANSAEEGYEMMTQVPIHVIVSDQRMPGMKGSEFFDRVKNEYPDAIRLLLTGYADIQSVIQAINDGNIFRYITKPWDAIELDTIVREAFEKHDLLVQNRKLLEELQEANTFLEQRIEERTTELSGANIRLQQLNSQKDSFLGTAAHDLRGPIGNIQSCIYLLKRLNTLPEASIELIDIVDDTSAKMLSLVNDLLDTNAIESGKLILEPKDVHLVNFIDRVQRLNHQLGHNKGIDLQVTLEREIGQAIFDPKRMEQVLDNLLGNAFKFSHSGSTVTLNVFKDANWLCFEVRDQGQGIKAEDLGKLFGTFQKTSTRPTGDETSSGLGLSICKRIIELHGGTIQVDSVWGEGTCFTVRLPIQPDK